MSFGKTNMVKLIGMISLILGACATPGADGESVANSSQALTGDGGIGAPLVVSEPFVAAQFDRAFGIHGVAGDTALLFAVVATGTPVQPADVLVARRLDGANVGSVAAPTGGWRVPLSAKVVSFTRPSPGSVEGQLLVLDAMVPPGAVMIGQGQPAKVYRVNYSYSVSAGLSTTLVNTYTLPMNTQAPGSFPNGVAYPGSLALLPEGRLAVTDSFTGAIWLSSPDVSAWSMAAIDQAWSFAPGPDIQGVGRAASGGTAPYTLRTPGPIPGGPGFLPGAQSVTYASVTDEVCWTVSTTPGGLYCSALSLLLDTVTPPFLKGSQVRTVVAPTSGLTDFCDGVDYDRFHPTSSWLYWHRAPSDVVGGGSNVLRRVHLVTGEVQEVARSLTVYDWTSEISVLPPLLPSSPLTTVLSSVGQEENNADVNVLLGGVSTFVGPAMMPVVVVGQQ